MGSRPKYLEALEALWRRNIAERKAVLDPALRKDLSPELLQRLPPQLRNPVKVHGLAIPEGLRGSVLVNYLISLAIFLQDKRFDDCISALLQHGIVKLRTWESAAAAQKDEDRQAGRMVRALDEGQPRGDLRRLVELERAPPGAGAGRGEGRGQAEVAHRDAVAPIPGGGEANAPGQQHRKVTFGFTGKELPAAVDRHNEYYLANCLAEVRARAERRSLLRASLEVAAEWGWPGNSLNAAAQQLRDHYRRWKKIIDVNRPGLIGAPTPEKAEP
jgi:hypothetical protein